MNSECWGCRKANDNRRSVLLGSGWSLGHYESDRESFLGWLALQPAACRPTMGHLTEEEAAGLGPILTKLEKGIYDYWLSREYPVERVYVMYLNEGLLEKKGDEPQHFHFHLVPRFKALASSMSNKTDVLGVKDSNIDAYLIGKLRLNSSKYHLPEVLDRMSCNLQNSHPLTYTEFEIVEGVASAAGFLR